MNRIRALALLAAAGALLVAFVFSAELPSLYAQWGRPRTAGVPRKPDGTPNLLAPAPKTADGKPDLSGLWEMKKDKPCPPVGCADQQAVYQFFDIGWGLPGGLPYQPWAADLVKTRTLQNGKDDPSSHCLPLGILKLHTFPYPRKFIQISGLLVILNTRDSAFRQIFTDGRKLPTDVELPSFSGFSTGRWQGDALVVETTGFKDGLWLDRNGSPLTGDARISEKFRRLNYGTMEIEVTVNDPKAYTKPWTVKLTQVIVLDRELVDYVCMENEKDLQNMIGQ